jgi:hypothetical protein
MGPFFRVTTGPCSSFAGEERMGRGAHDQLFLKSSGEKSWRRLVNRTVTSSRPSAEGCLPAAFPLPATPVLLRLLSPIRLGPS